jgi:predicted RNase H-like HicB family nuclease
MATGEIKFVIGAFTPQTLLDEWAVESFRCHVAITTEEEGDYSAIVLNLPGVGGCGDTVGEALAELKDAVKAAIASYRKSGEPIPWCDEAASDIPNGADLRWVVVTA